MTLEVEDVAGKDDGGSTEVRACEHFVLLVADAAAATAVEGGDAVVPAPVVASGSSGGGGACAGASIGGFEEGPEALCGGCAEH